MEFSCTKWLFREISRERHFSWSLFCAALLVTPPLLICIQSKNNLKCTNRYILYKLEKITQHILYNLYNLYSLYFVLQSTNCIDCTICTGFPSALYTFVSCLVLLEQWRATQDKCTNIYKNNDHIFTHICLICENIKKWLTVSKYFLLL